MQTLLLLGKFGENNLFGFTRIDGFKQLLGEGDDDTGSQCGFRLDVYTDLITTVFLRPALVAVGAMTMLWIDFRMETSPVHNPEFEREVKPTPLEWTTSGRNAIQSKMADVRSSQELVFLTTDAVSADNANGTLWRLCCEKTETELRRIARMRVLLVSSRQNIMICIRCL